MSREPLLIFEILSRSTVTKDKVTKYALYERKAVRYYIIVDPKEQHAEIYKLHEGRYIKTMDATDEN